MNRFGAFGVHLGISLVIFLALAAVVVFLWYPGFFFTTDGGWQGIRLIATVDLVLGPLLTLVVFDRNKPELRRDLTIIGVVQATCLAAGVFVVYSERPLALVYSDGSFKSVSADTYREAGLPVPDLSHLPGPYPKQVVVDLPEDPIAQSDIRRDAIGRKIPLAAMADLYVPLSYERLRADREAMSGDTLERLDQQNQALTQWLEARDGRLEDYAFFPYGARYDYVILAFSRASGEPAGLVDLPLVKGS